MKKSLKQTQFNGCYYSMKKDEQGPSVFSKGKRLQYAICNSKIQYIL